MCGNVVWQSAVAAVLSHRLGNLFWHKFQTSFLPFPKTIPNTFREFAHNKYIGANLRELFGNVFGIIFGNVFGMLFGRPSGSPEPPFWCSRLSAVHFFIFSLCRKKATENDAQKLPKLMPRVRRALSYLISSEFF